MPGIFFNTDGILWLFFPVRYKLLLELMASWGALRWVGGMLFLCGTLV